MMLTTTATPRTQATVNTPNDLRLALKGPAAFAQYLSGFADNVPVGETNNPEGCPIRSYLTALGVEEARVSPIALSGFVGAAPRRTRVVVYPEGRRAWIDRFLELADAPGLAIRTPDGEATRLPITAGQARAHLAQISAEVVRA